MSPLVLAATSLPHSCSMPIMLRVWWLPNESVARWSCILSPQPAREVTQKRVFALQLALAWRPIRTTRRIRSNWWNLRIRLFTVRKELAATLFVPIDLHSPPQKGRFAPGVSKRRHPYPKAQALDDFVQHPCPADV